MRRVSIRGLMLVVALLALVLGLVARLGGEAGYYVVGPIAGAVAACRVARADRTAALRGGSRGA